MLQSIHQNLHDLLLRRRSRIEHLLGMMLHLHLVLRLGEHWGARKDMVRLSRSVYQDRIAAVGALALRITAIPGCDSGTGVCTRNRCSYGRRN